MVNPATVLVSKADWVNLCHSKDIPRGAKQRINFEGRLLLVSRTRSGKVTVEDVSEEHKHNYSGHVPKASRSGELLRSWPAREAEGFIKIFLGRGESGVGDVDSTAHDLSPTDIEGFMTAELNSGVSLFHIPEEAQSNLNASVHLLARAKKRNSLNLTEIQSADPDSSASRTDHQTLLTPSLPSYVKFLAGPVADSHWKIGRAVSPDLANQSAWGSGTRTSSTGSNTQGDHKKASRTFSASRASRKESGHRPPMALEVSEDEESDHANKTRHRQRGFSAVSNRSAVPTNGKQKRRLRPITAAINSPARRQELQKEAFQKHMQRHRPMTALKIFDHLQEYRDSLPEKITPLKTDPESLEALSHSVTNFQRKMRESILFGLITKYEKRLVKKVELINKVKSEKELVANSVSELECNVKAAQEKLDEMDLEIENLEEQARPFEENVESIERTIAERGSTGKSERLQKELKEVRVRMNTIKGKIREKQAARKKYHLHFKVAKDKLKDKMVSQQKIALRLTNTIEGESKLRAAMAKVSDFVKDNFDGPIEIDENFPRDVAAAIKSIQEGVSLNEQQGDLKEKSYTQDRDDHDELKSGGDGNIDLKEEIKDEEDWRLNPSVWVRRREMAFRATSPRWRNRILEETNRWQMMKAGPSPSRKRVMDEEQLEAVSSPKKKIKSPCTKTFKETYALAATKYETSFFEKMKANCIEDWKQDFSDRLLMENTRDHRTNWFYQGLPTDMEADERKMREIRKDRQHPSPQEDLEKFREAMAGKWSNLDAVFKDIDKSGDGFVDVHEFSLCCKRLKLGWSEFQVHRVFRSAAGSDMQLDFVEFYNAFAPPRATSETKMLFQNKIPFLALEPESAVEAVVSSLVKVTPALKSKDFVYKVACDVQDHMYLILEGRVRILEANGNEVKTVGPGECFGEMAVIHSDLGEKGWLRRESAQAITDCVLYKLSKSDLERIYPRYPKMRDKLFKMSPLIECKTRAEARGVCPKYPDCYAGGTVYLNGMGLSKVKVEPKHLVPLKLREHEHLRTSVHHTHMGWPALTMETSVNENVPSGKSGARPEEGSIERTIRLRPFIGSGIESKKTFDDAPTTVERIDRIQKTCSSKFFRIKNLRLEGMKYVNSICEEMGKENLANS